MSTSNKRKPKHDYANDVRVKVYGSKRTDDSIVIRDYQDETTYFRLYDVKNEICPQAVTGVCEEIENLPEDFHEAYALIYSTGGYNVRI